MAKMELKLFAIQYKQLSSKGLADLSGSFMVQFFGAGERRMIYLFTVAGRKPHTLQQPKAGDVARGAYNLNDTVCLGARPDFVPFLDMVV